MPHYRQHMTLIDRSQYLNMSTSCSGELKIAAKAAILDFQSEWFLATFDLQHNLIHTIKSTGLSVQEQKFKIDFQDGGHGSHLGFLTETVLAIFDLQVALVLHIKFLVNWSFDSGKKSIE